MGVFIAHAVRPFITFVKPKRLSVGRAPYTTLWALGSSDSYTAITISIMNFLSDLGPIFFGLCFGPFSLDVDMDVPNSLGSTIDDYYGSEARLVGCLVYETNRFTYNKGVGRIVAIREPSVIGGYRIPIWVALSSARTRGDDVEDVLGPEGYYSYDHDGVSMVIITSVFLYV